MKSIIFFFLFFIMFAVLVVPASAQDGAPTITLLSQTPSVIYQNSTGPINISYGIDIKPARLNVSGITE